MSEDVVEQSPAYIIEMGTNPKRWLCAFDGKADTTLDLSKAARLRRRDAKTVAYVLRRKFKPMKFSVRKLSQVIAKQEKEKQGAYDVRISQD